MGYRYRAASAAGDEPSSTTTACSFSADAPSDRTAAEVAASLYRAEKPGLLRRLRRSVTGSDEPLDVIHDAFVRLLGLGPARFVALDREQPGAYLNRTTSNLVRNRHKASMRRSAHLHVIADDAVRDGVDELDRLEARDELRRFETVLKQLPPRPRAVYVAHRVDGLSYAEIAAQLGISVKGVEKHMTIAIRAIDQLLDRR